MPASRDKLVASGLRKLSWGWRFMKQLVHEIPASLCDVFNGWSMLVVGGDQNWLKNEVIW